MLWGRALVYTCRLPQWLHGKESTCNVDDVGDAGSIPGPGNSPGGESGNPLLVFLLGKSRGQRSLGSYSLWGGKESDTTEWLSSHVSLGLATVLTTPCCLFCLSYLPNSDIIGICNPIYANDSAESIYTNNIWWTGKKNWVESWSFRKTARKGDKWFRPKVIPEMWEAALSVSAVPNVSVNELTAVCMAHRCVGFLGQMTVSWRWMWHVLTEVWVDFIFSCEKYCYANWQTDIFVNICFNFFLVNSSNSIGHKINMFKFIENWKTTFQSSTILHSYK